MSKLLLSLALLAAAASSSAQTTGVVNPRPLVAATPAPSSCPALLKQSFKRLQDEAPQDLCQYAGKVVLVVNTASYCGYTKQYEGLEKLYTKYSPRGLVVLGFPSNDFKQEAASTKEIADLCYNTYGVKFPMFAPTVVTGANANPLHAALAKQTGKEPKWNFTKYLIGRDGQVIEYYPSKVTPEDPELLKRIEAAL
ncbi:glutathione peroxidase [Massilia suwonensis]|uniref:Glutathione peroxidase n=1 Tax=Massilia suwonensis TaxID=648895 RepID=A0ABW0MKW5_9BURK